MNLNHKDLLSTVSNQLWRLLSGPLTMVLIPLYLSESIQGYWYLFLSLSALTVFADLGFSNIVLQFSAHEFAYLSLNENGLLVGEDKYKKKISSLFRFIIKWISLVCIVAFTLIFFIGIWFLRRDGVLDQLILPWIIFSVGTVVNFLNYSIMSFIEGMNKIHIIQQYKLLVSVLNTIIVALVLILGGNIYALALASFISGGLIFLLVFLKFKKLFYQFYSISEDFIYPWNKEILPLFAKYSITFASGYFIFSIYIPLMQYFNGPIQAGKVGITLTLITAIFTISNIWVYTITPKMNILVSQNNKQSLDNLFAKRLLLAVITYILFSIFLILIYKLFSNFWIIPNIVSRFLPFSGIIILLICYFFQLLINSWATYIRAYKKEPYMIPSIIVALWVSFLTVIMGYYFNPDFFFVGFLTSYIWWLPVAYIKYKRFKIKLNVSN